MYDSTEDQDATPGKSALVTRAFDELAPDYDHAHHDAVARALIELVDPTPPAGTAADVACGSGAVAVALAALRTPDSPPILAVDLSPAMIDAGRARAAQQLDPAGDGPIDWRVGQAVPLPVPDGGLDLICCASSLHFLGAAALADWRRALRPGGQLGFTLPSADGFRAGGVFAELVAADLTLPRTPQDAARIATDAGFVDARTAALQRGSRTFFLVTAFRDKG